MASSRGTPLAAFKRPSARRREMRHWNADETAQFLDTVEDDRLYAAWLLFLQRGLRRGEVAGLRWVNVDLELGRLSIVHTRVMVDGRVVESEPKTSAGRCTVPLGARLVATLRAHRRQQLEDRLAWGEVWQDSGYVFTREDGAPLHPEHLNGAFETHVRRSGLPPIRLHDTRHTCATLALQAGEKTEVVSRWLGHSSVAITQDLYQHAIPSMIEEAGERLDEIVFSRRRLTADASAVGP
jgi:integrase